MTNPSYSGGAPPRFSRRSRRQKDKDELQRDRELVRSTGAISKHVMAMAFGLVFVLLGLAITVLDRAGWQGLGLAFLGFLTIALGVYSWVRKKRQANSAGLPTRSPEHPAPSDNRDNA